MSTTELARILDIGQSAISRSVQRAEKIAETEDFGQQLMEYM
jgi:DNA-binding transcriptional LysR family regulator